MPALRTVHPAHSIRSIKTIWLIALVAGFVALLAGVGSCTHLAAADPDALWKIVGGQCVPEARRDEVRPGNDGDGNDSGEHSRHVGPCALVDLKQRYAVLKDISGHTQYLLIPTDRVSGIESPQILYAGSPPYWASAWAARRYVQAQVKPPLAANQIGLEINASTRRSQNQLHIHIDCMRADVSATLAAHRDDSPNPPGTWREEMLHGRRYRIMHVMHATGLAGRSDPFRVVYDDLLRHRPDISSAGDAQQRMAAQTILVTGAGQTGDDGWLIVSSGTDLPGGTGSAEGLLDHACRIARQP